MPALWDFGGEKKEKRKSKFSKQQHILNTWYMKSREDTNAKERSEANKVCGCQCASAKGRTCVACMCAHVLAVSVRGYLA